jgi:mannose-1-phosphate guanylyltransferase/phosphomannomutase
LLQQLNCEVYTVSAPLTGEPLTLDGLREHFGEVAGKVRDLNTDLGIVMDPNAENLVLFDGQGRVVADDLFLALASLLVFRTKAGGTVAVPVTASDVIEKLAGQHKGRVLRTKTAPRSLMEILCAEEMLGGKLDQFTLSFDAIASLVKILEFMAFHETSLASLVDCIPPFHLHKKTVDCSWGAKGAVMRRLIEDTQGSEVELLDGVKVKHAEGWALVLPDPEKPAYRVYGEGYSAEFAEELTDLYVKKIKEIQHELEILPK